MAVLLVLLLPLVLAGLAAYMIVRVSLLLARWTFALGVGVASLRRRRVKVIGRCR